MFSIYPFSFQDNEVEALLEEDYLERRKGTLIAAIATKARGVVCRA